MEIVMTSEQFTILTQQLTDITRLLEYLFVAHYFIIGCASALLVLVLLYSVFKCFLYTS